jgi:hypothetical protein
MTSPGLWRGTFERRRSQMRGIRRSVGVVLLTTIAVLVPPSVAGANGGAYLEFDQTYYLSGDAGHAETYVSIPAGKEHLLDEGPFYVFALPQGRSLEEGLPIPPGAVRLGTVSVAEEDGAYELSIEFMVPALDPGGYGIGVCNDPCTISGFREPLTGVVSIVRTAREGTCSRSSRAWTPGSSVCVTNSGRPSAPVRSSGRSCSQARPSVSACRRS